MEEKINNKEICIVTVCPFCGHANEIEVNEADYWDWQDGELAQNAFPYLSADEREMLISGICPTCWEQTDLQYFRRGGERIMEEKILSYLREHPGARKREIASHLHIWQCSFEFLAAIDDLCEDGKIRYESYRDPAQMEFYDKWYTV